MKITAYNDAANLNLSSGATVIGDGGPGGDLFGELPAATVVGLNGQVSLGSNLLPLVLGDVLTIVQASPAVAIFATPSNTGSVSYGSNATRVAETPTGGGISLASRADHVHDGIATVTASSSNTLQRGTVNLRPGTNISFGLTDTDGEGELDTITINSTAAGGSGSALTIEEVDGSPSVSASKLVLPNGTLGVVGTVATYTPAASGGGTPDPSAFDTAVAALSPVTYWKMDEDASGFTATGTYTDDIGTNDLAVSGSDPVLHGHVGPFGPGSGAWKLTGGGSALSGSVITGTDDRSFIGWIKWSTPAVGRKIIFTERSAGAAGKYGLVIHIGASPVAGGISYHLVTGVDGDAVAVMAGAYNGGLDQDNWHFVVGTCDGTNGVDYAVTMLKLYLDGVELTTGSNATYNAGARKAPFQNEKFGIPASNFLGWISRVAVFDKVLTASEILGLYEASAHA